MYFVIIAIIIIVIAVFIVLKSLINSLRSIIIPTDIKKNGMKSEFPTNCILFINILFSGIIELSVRPAKNAPITGSKPTRCDKYASINSMVITKTYSSIPSSDEKLLKNHLVINGKNFKVRVI